MRADLLKSLRSLKDVTNAIVLTHNIDFVFVQSVLVPALRKCGSPMLTIFADADCAAHTYAYQARVLSGLGIRYRVVSVAMRRGFRFHPKAILLSGPSRATLHVGSGNLTFGGWRENGEVWTSFDTKTDGTAAFAAFNDYLREVVRLCAPPKGAVASEIAEAFDPSTRSWAVNMDKPASLLGRAGGGPAMLEKMESIARSDSPSVLYVCTPYFDADAEALRVAAKTFGVVSTEVLVQSKRSNLLVAAGAQLGSAFCLRAATYQHRDKGGKVRETFLHAKFFAVRTGDEVVVFKGSANCSRAALTIPGADGNAELVAYSTMTYSEFKEQLLDELVVADSEPTLADAQDTLDDEERVRELSIRSARHEFGTISTTFRAFDGVRVTRVEVDGEQLEPSNVREGGLTVHSAQQHPRMITLFGELDGAVVVSRPHWIDNEASLRASARGRSLAEAIHGNVRSDSWGIGAWSNVLSELHKHLQYMPKLVQTRTTVRQGADDGVEGPASFEWSDVFADGYGLPLSGQSGGRLGLDERVGSLRAMLLRWYGIAQPDRQDVDEDSPAVKEVLARAGADDEGDMDGDRVSKLPSASLVSPKEPISPKQRKKALRLISQVVERVIEPEFLSERRPEVLAADLKLVAILLRAGLADEWLSEDEFLDATLRIWLPLFFNAEGVDGTGWIEQRYLTAPDSVEFVKRISSVELAAALGCWALSVPGADGSPEHARFELASALGVARMPWLWQTGGNEPIAREISKVFALTSRKEPAWEEIAGRWLKLVRRGFALGRFEKAISGLALAELRIQIKQTHVDAGELLWQPGYGFCVARSACDRREKCKVEVLVLRQVAGRKMFMAPFVIPLKGLLEDGVLDDPGLDERACRELSEMVDSLRVDSIYLD